MNGKAIFAFLLFGAITLQLPAQQAEADRNLPPKFDPTQPYQVVPAQQTEADRKLLAGIRAKAEKGDAQSQAVLGRAFLLGELGLTKDEMESTSWYRKAAEQNLAYAQFWLGICYEIGRGAEKDEMKAVKWYRKAAEQNYGPGSIQSGHTVMRMVKAWRRMRRRQ